MSKKKKRSVTEKSATKKATVLNTEKKNRSHLRTALVVAVLVAGGLIFYALQTGFVFTPKAPPGIQPEVTATEVSFPAQAFSDGQAQYFQYPAGNGISIRFFILKSSDGVIRAAFDACDVCWREGKGYYQEGDFMVCRNCGRRFASVKVNEVKGGCNPAPLDRSVVGDKLVLRVSDILRGAKYFDFTGRS